MENTKKASLNLEKQSKVYKIIIFQVKAYEHEISYKTYYNFGSSRPEVLFVKRCS